LQAFGQGSIVFLRLSMSLSGWLWRSTIWNGMVAALFFGLPQWTASTWSRVGCGPHLNSVWQPPCLSRATKPPLCPIILRFH